MDIGDTERGKEGEKLFTGGDVKENVRNSGYEQGRMMRKKEDGFYPAEPLCWSIYSGP